MVDWDSVPANLVFPMIDKDYVNSIAPGLIPLKNVNEVPYFSNHRCTDYFGEAFPWNMDQAEEASKSLVEVARIWTLHGYGYYGLFKPSIAEVVMQVPKELIGTFDHFMTIGPEDSNDMFGHVNTNRYVNEGKHVAQTVLYKLIGEDRFVGTC